MSFLDNGLYSSPWKLYSSEDKNASLLILSGGWGAFYAKNNETGEDLKIRVHFFGGGPSVGCPINVAKSDKEYPSGGVGQVGVRNGHVMWRNDFAGRGWIIQAGATAGLLLQDGETPSGADLAIIFFGTPPFWHKAVARMWGMFQAVAPSAGISFFAATFYVDD
jgi:hypothetical protein